MHLETTRSGTIFAFPLNLVRPSLDKYFVGSDGGIYSTKQAKSGKARKMLGSGGGSNHGYFTLNNVSFSGHQLRTMAANHKDYEKHMSPEAKVVEAVAANVVKDRDHATGLQIGLKGKGWVIARVDGVSLALGSAPKVHMTDKSVKAELERLALSKPGVQFVSLKVDTVVKAGGIEWS